MAAPERLMIISPQALQALVSMTVPLVSRGTAFLPPVLKSLSLGPSTVNLGGPRTQAGSSLPCHLAHVYHPPSLPQAPSHAQPHPPPLPICSNSKLPCGLQTQPSHHSLPRPSLVHNGTSPTSSSVCRQVSGPSKGATMSLVTGSLLGKLERQWSMTGLTPFRYWYPKKGSSHQCSVTYSRGARDGAAWPGNHFPRSNP